MRSLYLRVVGALALTAAIAAAALAVTYSATKNRIATREAADRKAALSQIFFEHKNIEGNFHLEVEERFLDSNRESFFVIKESNALGESDELYYVFQGAGIGYTTSSPIQILVAFTNPNLDARPLLEGYVPASKLPEEGKKGLYIVGWRVTQSQETPGLGEKIKDEEAVNTWTGILTGTQPDPEKVKDRATPFQKQFRGMLPATIALKKDGGEVDSITAATYTVNGVIDAMRNAAEKANEYFKKTSP